MAKKSVARRTSTKTGPTRKSPRRSAQLDRDIADVLLRSQRRGHATKTRASLWAEVGLEEASDREKARFWREALLSDVDDVEATGVSSALRPVLADIAEVVDPDVLRMLAKNQLSSIDSSDYRDAVRELREQIANASNGQIVQYANDHYRSLA